MACRSGLPSPPLTTAQILITRVQYIVTNVASASQSSSQRPNFVILRDQNRKITKPVEMTVRATVTPIPATPL